MTSMFSNFTKFIDQMDAQVGEIVQKQHQQENEHSATTTDTEHQNHQNVIDHNSNFSSLPPPPQFQTTSSASSEMNTSQNNGTTPAEFHHHHQQQQQQNQLIRQGDEQRQQQQNQLSSSSSSLQHDFDVAISRLKQATTENQFLHHQIEALRSQHDEAKSKITSVEHKLQILAEIQSRDSISKNQLEQEFRDLHSSFEHLQRENSQLTAKAAFAEESLTAALRESEKTKSLASARILELEKSEIDEKMAELETEVAILKRSLQNVREERDSFRQKLDDHAAEAANHRVKHEQTNSDLNNNHNSNNAISLQEIENLQHQVAALKKEQELERAANRTTRARFEQMVSEKMEEVAILEKQLNRLNNNNNINNANNHNNTINKTTLDNINSGVAISTSSTEWEKRAKDLADLVMEKQAALELKRNESDQWRSRFETAQQRLREAELMAAVSNNSNIGHRAITISTSEGGNENNNFHFGGDENDISKNVLVAMLTRQLGTTKPYVVAGVAGLRKIDHVVQRIISSLKKNSLLRLAVAFYVLLVHLWIVVLIWNAPLPHDGNNGINTVNANAHNVASVIEGSSK